jgi:hypothetical protein
MRIPTISGSVFFKSDLLGLFCPGVARRACIAYDVTSRGAAGTVGHEPLVPAGHTVTLGGEGQVMST